MFIRDIHASDQARKDASMNLSTRLGSHSLVLPFVNHQASLSWRDMGSDRKQQYNDQAEDERLDQIECIDARKMKLIIKLAALRTSLTCSDNFSDQPLRLSQCSMIMQDLHRFDRMHWAPGFTCSAAISLIPDGGFKIMAPNASSIAVLEAISIHELTRTRPTWINNIVWNRD